MKPGITDEQFLGAAVALDCDEAAIRAVADVESAGSGFLADGQLCILFEGHHFYALVNGKYAKSHPDICYPKWDPSKYAKGRNADARGLGELDRLARARALNEDAALRSCSMGRFQILGDNCEECGYLNVRSFWDLMNLGEGFHLLTFVRLIKHFKLQEALKRHDWKTFARVYNGPRYAENKYDIKMAQAHIKHSELILSKAKNRLTESTA